MAKILIVDDSSFMRKRIAQSLEEAGHQVVGQARDGKEGFEAYKQALPDVVVMDVTMRGTDGITGARMIKEYAPQARIIFMSLVSDPDVRSQAKELGAEDFLGKKDYDRLLDLISKEAGG